MNETPSVVALIPARQGSKRVPGKNVRELNGHPVLAYSIAAALESGVFNDVIVSTDSDQYAAIARRYGAEVPFLRPQEMAGDHSPDIEWIEHTLCRLRDEGRTYDCFAILRPTSPFRTAATIRRAWKLFSESGASADSLRAVQLCKEHPGKMWVIRGNRLLPLLPFGPAEQPWHSTPYQSLPPVYIQNASLEIAWSRVVFETRTIAGTTILPFLTEGLEGFDINQPTEWALAEDLLKTGQVSLATPMLDPGVGP